MMSTVINDYCGVSRDGSDVQENLRKYFSHASSLTVEDGLILQGEALLIPEFKRQKSYSRYMMDIRALPR